MAGLQEPYIPVTQKCSVPSCKSQAQSSALPAATALLSSADTFQYLSGLHLSHILLTHTFLHPFHLPSPSGSLSPSQLLCSSLSTLWVVVTSRGWSSPTPTLLCGHSLCSASGGFQQAHCSPMGTITNSLTQDATFIGRDMDNTRQE